MKENDPAETQAIVHQKKQMKVFLSTEEHAVVTLAANLKGMNVGDYMKRLVIEQAKKDAKEMNKLIDSI